MRKIREIRLIDRKKNLNFGTYEVSLVIHTKISNRTIVKLGLYDIKKKLFLLNIFRFIYWISKDAGLSYKLMKLLIDINFFDMFNGNNLNIKNGY